MQEGEEAVGRARMFVLRVLRVSVLVGSLDLYGPILRGRVSCLKDVRAKIF